ncbi:hypothetical protein HX021_17820 [Sphingobacterium sp. N143]|uniref:hypothetical protein n=1 Tax=Sphingobacterium sp. N143 TaxID=2746727 RepID=UPI002578AA87|nr:hypothetical protein [Sphingobacterium sp. N143]MDM1296147.1 hypothetical protein [Sphingobacterium sp. N143]
MAQETKLYRNRQKTIKLLSVSGAICLFLMLVLLYAIGIFDGVLKVKLAVFSGAVLCVLFILLIVNLLNLRDQSAQIILDETHFQGKTTPLSKAFGAGKWEDVVAVRLQKVGGDTMVIVTLDNIAAYKDRLPALLWKMAYHEPSQELNIMYSASVIDIDATALYELFMSYWKTAGGAKGEK